MFKRVLVPLDESSIAEEALGVAAGLARASGGEVELVLADANERSADGPSATAPGRRQPEEHIYLRAAAEELSRRAEVPVTCAIERGPAVDVIVARAHEIGADLIVMTSHGRTGLSRAWLGSVADGVVREASVPVLMLRALDASLPGGRGADAARPAFARMLVPVDGSPLSEAIIDAAVAMAHATGATLAFVRIVNPVAQYVYDPYVPAYPSSIRDADSTRLSEDEARLALSELALRVERGYGVRVETEVLVAERTAEAILEAAAARKVDLIAMTTHGRGASRLVVGSLTDKVLRGSRLPLLVYHPRPTGAPVHEWSHRAPAAEGAAGR